MARKATDLLDVFRAEHPAAGGAGSARPKERAAPAKRDFAGMVLLPRQILLGSAVVVLLLVFTFVLGLSVGRSDGSGEGVAGAKDLSRVSPRDAQARLTYVEARVPYMDPARHVANDPATLRDSLVRTRGVSADHIWIADDVAAQRLRVVIGPFRGSEEGVEFLRRYGLLTFKLGGVLPWKSPDYPSYTVSELPLSRLPRR